MSRVKLGNPHLMTMKDDTLYHFGLSRSTTDFASLFGDVKFVCTGGSWSRIKNYADLFSKMTGLPSSDNLSKSDRFCLYKTGAVIWVNHGMGVPSMSIMLNEILKLLYYATATDVTFIRLGTSGGVKIPIGTVVVSTGGVNTRIEPEYSMTVAGKTLKFPCELDKQLALNIYQVAQNKNYNAVMGKTMCGDDFYEGQMRLDGAFCDAVLEEKIQFLNDLENAGVKNIEMEATGFAAITRRAGCKAAIVCVTLVNRFDGDQVDIPHAVYKEYEMRPFKVVSTFICNKLGYSLEGL